MKKREQRQEGGAQRIDRKIQATCLSTTAWREHVVTAAFTVIRTFTAADSGCLSQSLRHISSGSFLFCVFSRSRVQTTCPPKQHVLPPLITWFISVLTPTLSAHVSLCLFKPFIFPHSPRPYICIPLSFNGALIAVPPRQVQPTHLRRVRQAGVCLLRSLCSCRFSCPWRTIALTLAACPGSAQVEEAERRGEAPP